MNTAEIECSIRRHAARGSTFDGVFSADRLPDIPHLLVINTDPSRKPGSHWVTIYVDDEGRCGEYFDSFGRPPLAPFRRYLDMHCARWTFNESQLQSIASPYCIYYCIYYCVLRSRGVDMRRIVNSFTGDTGYNDVLVHAFLCKHD